MYYLYSMQWDSSIEKMLSIMADEAQIKSMLHHNCHLYNRRWSLLIQIPVIMLSSITGGGNFISTSALLVNFKDQLIFILGTVSLFIAFISAVYKYLGLDIIVEGHRISSLSWNKLFNDIRHQITISPPNRQNASDFMRTIKGDYDRLIEISPMIPTSFITSIKKKIKDAGFEKPYYLGNIKHMSAQSDMVIKDLSTEIDNIVDGIDSELTQTAKNNKQTNSSTEPIELNEIHTDTVVFHN